MMSTTNDNRRNSQNKNVLQRVPFETSRLMDFFSEKELTAQCGHEKADWPLVILKELIDNSLAHGQDRRPARTANTA
jgi:hypothetical protein